jgi:hypothetical protein
MTIRAGDDPNFADIIVWSPDGHPLSHIFEFDTETCQMMFYPKGINPGDQGSWKHPLEYVHEAKGIKFRNTPPDAIDSIIMTLPGAYATKEAFTPGSQPNPAAPRLY